MVLAHDHFRIIFIMLLTQDAGFPLYDVVSIHLRNSFEGRGNPTNSVAYHYSHFVRQLLKATLFPFLRVFIQSNSFILFETY